MKLSLNRKLKKSKKHLYSKLLNLFCRYPYNLPPPCSTASAGTNLYKRTSSRNAVTPPRYQQQAYSPRPATPRAAPVQQQATAPIAAEPSHAPVDMRLTQLTPPAQPSAADQRRMRRSESLFTRITGFGLVRPSSQQEDIEEVQLPDESLAATPPLGISPEDRPALSSEANDRLEIPAFLRRQTNH